MARIPLNEVFFQDSAPPSFARRREAFIYKPNTTEQLTVYREETGPATFTQPLETDHTGRLRVEGIVPWMETGNFDVVVGTSRTAFRILSSGGGGGEPTGPAGGDLAGEYPNPSIGSEKVTESKLGALAVVAAKIAAGAVTATKIGSEAVESAAIKAGAVTAAKLGAEAVEAAAIKALAVTTAKLAAEAVTAEKLGGEAVEEGKIRALAVSAAKIASEAVTEGKIASGAVSAAKLASNAVETAKVKAEAITEEKLASAVQTKLKGANVEVHSFALPGKLEATTYRLYYVATASGETKKLVGMKYSLGSGTKAKATLKQNGSAITGFKEVELKTEAGEVTGKSVSLSAGDLITLTVETVEGEPKDTVIAIQEENTR